MASSTPRAGQVLFPGGGSTLRGGSPMSRSRGGGGGVSRNLQCLSMIFFAVTCLSFWMTIINFHKAAMYSDDNTSDKPNLTERQFVNNRIAETIKKTNIGSLGPSNTSRTNLQYYDSVFYTTLQYASEAKTSIEVGCANDPFIKYLDWIDKRTCVAPYFIDYKNEDNTEAERNMNTKLRATSAAIEKVTADFMEYKPPNDEKFDLLVCSQVLEHIPSPASFMKKLIETAKVSIISVPYNWGNCGETCNHVTHYITQKMLLDWSYPYKPVHTAIVTEPDRNVNYNERIILVFINDGKPLKESLKDLNNLLIKQKMSESDGDAQEKSD